MCYITAVYEHMQDVCDIIIIPLSSGFLLYSYAGAFISMLNN